MTSASPKFETVHAYDNSPKIQRHNWPHVWVIMYVTSCTKPFRLVLSIHTIELAYPLVFVIWLCDLVSINRHSVGSRMTTLIQTQGDVYHMEADLKHHGNILFLDSSALKTTNGISVNTLAGNSLERRYHKRAAIDARFRLITGFAQLSSDIVVIVDHFSNCLRRFDRQTRKITKARFHRPHSVYVRVGLPDDQYARDPSILYVVDTMNEALLEISFRTNKVSDVLKSEMLSGFTTVFHLSGDMSIPIGSNLFDVVSATKI